MRQARCGADRVADVAVVVVNHDTREHLADCLSSLAAAADGLELKVVVIDNASGDGSAEMVGERFADVDLVAADDNLGFGRACNLAAERVRAPFLAFLNPDVVCEPGSLRQLVEELRRHPEVAAAGPRLRNGDGTLQTSAYRFPTLATECANALGVSRRIPVTRLREVGALRRWMPATGHFDLHDRARAVDFVTGACIVIRASAFAEIGGFDESFFLYYEEIDLCRRLGGAAWEVRHVPSAGAVHYLNRSGMQKPALAYLARQHSRLLFHRKHTGRGSLRTLRVAVGIAAATGLARHLLRSGSLHGSPHLQVLRWARRPGVIAPGAAGVGAYRTSGGG